MWHRLVQSVAGAPAAVAPEAPLPPPGPEVWAAQGRSGPVPVGWVGLRVTDDGHCLNWVAAGQFVPPPGRSDPEGTLWWVRDDDWAFQFALWPEQAPEAGLEIRLRLDCEPQADHRMLLARSLARQANDLTAERWAAQFASLVALRSLPPCPSHEVLAAARDSLAVWAHGMWRVRLKSLRRVDLALAPESTVQTTRETPLSSSAEAASLNAPPAAAPSQTAAPESAAPSAHAPPPATVPQATLRAAPALADMLAQDARIWALVASELPRLSLALERRWAGGGWSQDPVVAARQRDVAQRLALMAGKLGTLPSLAPGRHARPGAGTDAQRSLVWAHDTAAIEALVRAQAAMGVLPEPRIVPTAEQLVDLERALHALDGMLHLRLHPWWE